jgi:hypothetical protein
LEASVDGRSSREGPGVQAAAFRVLDGAVEPPALKVVYCWIAMVMVMCVTVTNDPAWGTSLTEV